MSLTPSVFPIVKISATGNDFLLVDLLSTPQREIWQSEFGQEPRGELTRKWCDRHEGLGADGLVILERDETCDFKWDFYNSDGGSAEMCGNAARAVSLYYMRTRNKSEIRFHSKIGEVQAIVRTEYNIEVNLPPVVESDWKQSFQGIDFDFIRAGVPHAVVKIPALTPKDDLRETALKLKMAPRFQPEGVNVTFVHAISSQQLECVTYERGVEGFTRACGTGAIAAAFSLTRGEDNRVIEVQVPGGQLFVVWKKGRPFLRGPAKIIAEMHVIKEA
jgi:diaminopimelate epimerase